MPRLFIGIKIDSKNIISIANELKKQFSSSNIAWVEPQNFHLTLKFLGDVDVNLIDSISNILIRVCSKYNSFELISLKLGYFGSIYQPRVIWYGFKSNPILALLQDDIDHSLHELGFDLETKEFNVHLTFGRVKHINEQERFREILKGSLTNVNTIVVSQFQLIESILRKEGPEYKILKVFELQK
jgi:RNA 2',3'-cyclic 3'-phosphodiesterase